MIWTKGLEKVLRPMELGIRDGQSRGWRWTGLNRMAGKDRTHSDTASGRGGRNRAAGLPQSVSEHCERGGGFRGWEEVFSERDVVREESERGERRLWTGRSFRRGGTPGFSGLALVQSGRGLSEVALVSAQCSTLVLGQVLCSTEYT